MKRARFAALLALSFLAAPAFGQQTLFATGFSAGASWTNALAVTGPPGGNDCNTTNGPYAINMTGSGRLTATSFDVFSLPAGQRIVRVQVGVMTRFDMNMPDDAEIRALWTEDGNTQQTIVPTTVFVSNGNSSGNCDWEDVDITSFGPNGWSVAEVNSLQVDIRRANASPNNWLRVRAFRVIVTTEACGGLSLLCNGAPNSTGQATALSASGPFSASAPLLLSLTGGPANSIGFTYIGRPGIFQPAGNGTLCLDAASIRRVYPPVLFDQMGNANVFIPPTHPAFANVTVGFQTVVQFVYRDSNGARFNLSHAISGYPCP